MVLFFKVFRMSEKRTSRFGTEQNVRESAYFRIIRLLTLLASKKKPYIHAHISRG